MTNHYHLVVETPDANLSAGMRQLNGVFTQRFNSKYKRSGHLFQGRFKGINVDKSTYLLELSRYVVLNPVRAGMVDRPEDWRWSSYLYTLKQLDAPHWLAVDALLRQFADTQRLACQHYSVFVADGVGIKLWEHLRQQVYLGDQNFVSELQNQVDMASDELSEVPHKQKRIAAQTLEYYMEQCGSRNEGIWAAYQSGAFTMKAIADYCNVHYSTVSKVLYIRELRAQ